MSPYESAPRTARRHIAQVPQEWSLAEFCDVASLIGRDGEKYEPASAARQPGDRFLGIFKGH